MARVRKTPAAQRDMREILAYIADDNPDAAFAMIDRFDAALLMLADNPMAGQARPELLDALRTFPVGRYLLCYRPEEGGIQLLRVLHGARDLNALFPPE